MDVSVVVPTYNRRPVLQRTVECLLAQDAPGVRYEIVVVDDRSTDDTWASISAAQASDDRVVRVANPSKGRGQARNAGAKTARGQIVCFVDDDVWVAPGFVAAHWHAHRGHGPNRVVIGGLGVCPETPPGIANEYEDARITRVEQRIAAAGDELTAGFFRTGNVSLHRSMLEAVGGFDESFRGYSYEDSELGYRLTAAGAKFGYVPAAAGVHYTEITVAQVLQKTCESGRSAVLFLQRCPAASTDIPVPFAVPGVAATARYEGTARRMAKAIALSGASEIAMRGLLTLVVATGHRRAGFFVLDWTRWVLYSRAFREAVQADWVDK